MRLLFPSDPFDKLAVEPEYLEEFEAARALGVKCHLFSYDDFEAGLHADFRSGTFKPRSAGFGGEKVVYRGWMLRPESYSRLHDAIAAQGGVPVTTPAQYRLCHHLPEWYPSCAEFTPRTIVVSSDADFVSAAASTGWSGFFVKDYVKSPTTQRGSVASTVEEVAEVAALLRKYRGSIEGGVCIREFERFEPGTEQRCFVLNGRAHAIEGAAPALVHTMAERIDSPFFSVDTVIAEDGTLRLVELGDGQVSDKKGWPARRLISLLAESQSNSPLHGAR